MIHINLWFSILSFTVIFAVLGLAAVYFMRKPSSWMKYFLLYLGSMTLFQIFFSVTLFSQFYLDRDLELFLLFFNFFRLAVSCVLLYTFPGFVLLLSGKPMGPRKRLLLFVLPGILLAAGSVVVIWELHTAASVLNTLFYFYLSGFALFGIIKTKPRPEQPDKLVMVVFLYLSLLFYVGKGVDTIWTAGRPPEDQAAVVRFFYGPLFIFLWGMLFLIFFVLVFTGKIKIDEGARFESFRRFGITEREMEIIQYIVDGDNNKEIGEKLFISARTVETHLYNIYRKMKVKNRIELIRTLKEIST